MNARIFLLLGLVCSLWACKDAPDPPASSEAPKRYDEPHRPQFHFTPDSMWMNDPNGMVYFEEEYHLFYQFYPDSNVWGPMHWGHAVSPDMVHWKHLPIALYPDSLGYIFSGSAVIDWQNTSGFGAGSVPPMVAIFSHHDPDKEAAGDIDYQTQSIAYSLDRGRNWTKYAENPVVANPGKKDFRDPKVIWHEPTQQWVMVLAVHDRVHLYVSPNLKDWEFASEWGVEGDERKWECPDLFPMVADDGTEHWVLIVSMQLQAPNGGTGTAYWVGEFDGVKFSADPAAHQWIDVGTDNYALVTWSDIPEEDGRTLALGWMSNWQYAKIVPTTRWRSAMTLPRELKLKSYGDTYRVCSMPVEEVKSLMGTPQLHPLDSGDHSLELPQALVKLDLEGTYPPSGGLELALSNEAGDSVFVGLRDHKIFVDRTQAGIADFHTAFAAVHTGLEELAGDSLRMTVYVDRASLEIFVNDGAEVMTELVFPKVPYSQLSLKTDQAWKLSISPLSGIW
ncbi:glycoside hydrolase family 32 protein [Pontibacter sp. G13]|uniref:glycoside hydrolase family 32 protein n=1 Tax=Pontibacter sp. G13 TaxID=3074898 RepID=UPI00288A67FA|nr:glycoside hydrolase family 32 protein [Pontibacter sp. G13]WNJ18437.1 glycoside hydrolase family 32 protein [Pontibacter sp. G13]